MAKIVIVAILNLSATQSPMPIVIPIVQKVVLIVAEQVIMQFMLTRI